MAKKSKQEEQSGNEQLMEEPSALADKLSSAEGFVKKNRNILSYIGVGIAIGIGALLFYLNHQKEQEQEAQEEMFRAVFHFEKDSLQKALTGDMNNLGFLDIVNDYSGTTAANLANFYIGVIYLERGNYDDAIYYLKNFEASDIILQGRAYSLIGDAYMEKKEYGQAVDYFEQAVDYKPNKHFTPRYMMKLALAHEENGNVEAAVEVYNELIKKYPESSLVPDAKKYKTLISHK